MFNQLIHLIVLYSILINKFIDGYSDKDNYGYADSGTDSKFNLLQSLDNIEEPSNRERESGKINSKEEKFKYDLEHWTGKWMPDKDHVPTNAPEVQPSLDMDMNHDISMGDINTQCDDGKHNLIVDWDNSPVNYTCYHHKITPSYSIHPEAYCEHIPRYYRAQHLCMADTIEYDDNIPVFGTHRPAWPVYGEYQFLPRQRWIHSLEHGAVVMLYHPCANPLELKKLKSIVKKCLRRHIITAHNLLDEERPLALVTWGCRLTMSYVNPNLVRNFIRMKALRGAESIAKDGSFEEKLLKKAKTVSDHVDSVLCPLRVNNVFQ